MNGVCVINFSASVYGNEEICQPVLQCGERQKEGRKERERKRNLICAASFYGFALTKKKKSRKQNQH